MKKGLLNKIKKIKLISIDGDGCLFSYENVGSRFHSSWDALGFAYGLKDRWDKRINIFYKKDADDFEWARRDVNDLKGRLVEDSLKILYPVPFCEGAKEFAEKSKERFVRGVLSTAIDLVVYKSKEELGLDFAFCNVLHRENGCFTGTHTHNVPIWRKHEKLPEICKRYGVKLEEICHVGDNENDIYVGRKVGLFIALKPKKQEVRKLAHYTADDFFDIMRLLKI